MTVPVTPAPQWRCYCPISLCRALDPYGIWHALAYVRDAYGAGRAFGITGRETAEDDYEPHREGKRL